MMLATVAGIANFVMVRPNGASVISINLFCAVVFTIILRFLLLMSGCFDDFFLLFGGYAGHMFVMGLSSRRCKCQILVVKSLLL